ncbi:ZIP family transporter [Reticulomyxa filosa]|uniref:ZIP family transporter n=1 Tax=Reticulomyxa filosa TaxID=46433 RepID=X6NGD0_RETFI|nr:ZIP family transporter [Reticulomyxa filosa]|eukprot:ETO24387.1 ZIP family transporter [Reticulomyxa filosa]
MHKYTKGDSYPWPFVLTAFSFLLILMAERLALLFHTYTIADRSKLISASLKNESDEVTERIALTLETGTNKGEIVSHATCSADAGNKIENRDRLGDTDEFALSKHIHLFHKNYFTNVNDANDERDHHHDHDHEIEVLELLQLPSSFGSVVVLLLGLSLHNFLEALSLGAASNLKSLTTLSIAICIHHYLASFSLGRALGKSKKSPLFVWAITLLYGFIEPVAIAIGLGVNSVCATWVSALLECFASGTFLFVAIVDVLIPAFEKEHKHLDTFSPKQEGLHELRKLLCVYSGFGFMSLLAIWT